MLHVLNHIRLIPVFKSFADIHILVIIFIFFGLWRLSCWATNNAEYWRLISLSHFLCAIPHSWSYATPIRPFLFRTLFCHQFSCLMHYPGTSANVNGGWSANEGLFLSP